MPQLASPEDNLSTESSTLHRIEGPLIVTGVLLGAYGLARKSPVLTAGAAFGALGLLAFKQRPPQAEARPAARSHDSMTSFAIRCSLQRAYREWRNFENLPRFISHLQSVTVAPDSRLQWTVAGPLGSHFRWNAEIVDDVEDERITWRSLPGSMVENSGSIEFRQGTPDRGIIITLRMRYASPAGALGRAFLSAVGRNPEFAVREDLRRFKAYLETGEIPTTAGQPHGPRGAHGRVLDMLLRETSNMAQPSAREWTQPMGGAARPAA